MIGSHVTRTILEILNGSDDVGVVNDTFIVLILKVKEVRRMHEFKTISPCNVVYKIVSKVLGNHLKLVLPSVISLNQSAFIRGRLISDNVLAAFEVFHFIKNKRHRKNGCFALKLDISKAYDHIKCGFL
ncbi:uncharacterized protein LOC114308764 [Camellia sinensis]|uniref:uncharacterized protein LOC114308764 n=1 Tax=Camellia sinensis TaxID=4442 RepID=UPI00103660BE|nr:uncharacterized protein LOC114308764 [Camellia sinensis]